MPPSKKTRREGRKRKPKLFYHGKIYLCEKSLNGSTYYRCAKTDCVGRAVKKNEKMIIRQPHTCTVGSLEVSIEKAKEFVHEWSLKNFCAHPEELLPALKLRFPVEVLQALPDESTLKGYVRRYRRKREESFFIFPQDEEEEEDLRAKDAADEKMRELFMSAGDKLKPVEIVRRVLSEMSPEDREGMPPEETFVKKVRRWMNASKQCKEAPLFSLEDMAALAEEGDVKAEPIPSSSKTIGTTRKDDENTTETGKISFEPASLPDLIDPDTGESKPINGLVFLKQNKVDGRHRAMVGGHIFLWDTDLQRTVQVYKCKESKRGCGVTVTLFLRERRYEVRGSHVHDNGKKEGYDKSRRCVPNLKLVDDDGNEIRDATLGDLLAENPLESTMDSVVSDSRNEIGSNQSVEQASSSAAVPEVSSCNEDTNDDYMDNDGGDGDDFQGDDYNDELEEESSVPVPVTLTEPRSVPNSIPGPKSRTVRYEFKTLTSSPGSRSTFKTKDPNAEKTGELCFVCGDELIVSEKLACSQETFKKACYYLNVRSEQEWFPKSRNGQFYSFCESCTKEIMRIHDLYKKVEEIQSMIFQKVESVEKRIVDAEIVDHWMATAPPTTAIRYEGFRKQVMINYRNKLKLRREVRQARKVGHNLSEAQPVTTARMFATNPSATDAFRRIVPGEEDETESPEMQEVASPSPRRTRGRPKSKKTAADKKIQMSESALQDELEHDDVGFQDFDDARSVVSEKEVKFWHQDPSKLKLAETTERDDDGDSTGDGDAPMDQDFGGGIEDDGGNDFNDEDNNLDNDSDYDDCEDGDDDDDDDEDWGAAPKRGKGSSKRTKRSVGRTTTHKKSSVNPQSEPTSIPTAANQILSSTSTEKSKVGSAKSIQQEPKISKQQESSKQSISSGAKEKRKNMRMEFPETVLHRDGRIFMQGVEIIKNPPGHKSQVTGHDPKPYSVSFTCGECGKTMLSFWKIREHICGAHLGTFTCNICLKQYTCKSQLRRHATYDHDPEAPTFPCEVCGKPFKEKIRNTYHRWSHLSEEEKKDPANSAFNPDLKAKASRRTQTFMCSYCSKTFYVPSALKRHEMTHTGDSRLQCQYCGRLCKNAKVLCGHVAKCRLKAEGIKLSLPCPKCPDIRFSSSQTRAKHIRRFHSNATSSSLPFTCQKCPRSFSTKEGYKSHRRVCTENSTSTTRGSRRGESFGEGNKELQNLKEVKTDADNDQNQSEFSGVGLNSTTDSIGFGYNMLDYPGTSTSFSNQLQ